MGTLEELKKLNVNNEEVISFLTKLKNKDETFIHSFKIIEVNGKAMEFNNFLIASDDDDVDLLCNNELSLLPPNYLLFGTGPNGESFVLNKNNGKVSCFLLDSENDEREEVELAPSFSAFIKILERIKPYL